MGAQQSTAQPPPAPLPPVGCPMHDATKSSSPAPTDALNPLNNIPTLAQAPAAGQTVHLPLERTLSSIPRAGAPAGPSACPVASGSAAGKVDQWEYPSPQQFYNALVRKGWETPEESVEMMVHIHNWLNEAAWQQVRHWEEKHFGGDRSSLAKFEGRPKDLSPKARYHLVLGTLFPSRYDSVRPFDRHDWTIHRPAPPTPNAAYTAASPAQAYSTHRYVIDYYALPDDAEGNPVFSLDVRPAVDSPAAVVERLGEWWKLKKDTYWGAGEKPGVPGQRVQEDK